MKTVKKAPTAQVATIRIKSVDINNKVVLLTAFHRGASLDAGYENVNSLEQIVGTFYPRAPVGEIEKKLKHLETRGLLAFRENGLEITMAGVKDLTS